jgi:diguanylate cyclase (GGDEF)-like protein
MERLSLAIKDPRLRLRAMYVVVFALGVLFSVLIVAYSQQVLDGSRLLVRADLPLLARISDLKVEIARQESTLYDYHATGDQTRFERDYAASVHRSQDLLNDIERAYGNEEPIPSVRTSLARLDGLAGSLRDALDASPAANSAYPILTRVTDMVRELHAELDVLARLIDARVYAHAMERQDAVTRMAQLAILFSMAIFLVAVFVGYYINAYLQASVERRRLAVFAERNPNPVMRLALDGDIIYANAAATELARRMGNSSARVLLPENLKERLKAFRGNSERYEVWQYQREARSLECGIHFLPDLDSFHTYIADATERRLSEEKLAFQAYHNLLTGLPNRRMFHEVVGKTLLVQAQGGAQAAVLMVGVDRFKVVMDTLGHVVGDQVLQAIAARLTLALEGCRDLAPNATLYHFDGDLFAVFVTGLTGPQAPAQIAERLVASSTHPLYVAGREFFLTFSAGIAIFPSDANDATDLVKNADSAMQDVQSQGGRGLRLYKPEMNAMATHWLALESHLRHAIERNELRLYYQPQIDLRTGRVVALEALLRWMHPQWGLLSPKDFMRLAEESDMILAIGDWVLHAACAQNREWRSRGLLNALVAVNISARQFHRQNLPDVIAAALERTGLPPDALEIEITESVAMQDLERTAAMLRELKDMGVRVAIDDFGTGFSSLAYLKRFPIDKLKIDQSFVRPITNSEADASIVRAIVTLGHALKLRVGAEGVATQEQLARLRQYDCDEAQGELYSQAVPPSEVERFLRTPQRVAT